MKLNWNENVRPVIQTTELKTLKLARVGCKYFQYDIIQLYMCNHFGETPITS